MCRKYNMKHSWITLKKTLGLSLGILLFCFGMNTLAEDNSAAKTQTPTVVQNKQVAQNTTDHDSVAEDPSISSMAKTVDKTCAILMAINDYKNVANLDPLNGCNNDIESVNKWLSKLGSTSDEIQILSDDQKKFPNALKPSYNNFNKVLNKAVNQECDRLIVVCACHGISMKNKSFLCPIDVKIIPTLEENEDPLKEGQKNNLLSIDSILTNLKKSKAKEILLILDACRDGGEGNFMTEFEDLLKDDTSFQKEDSCFAVITSCSFNQSAHEISEKIQGAFIFHLMDGLNNRKADYMGCNDGEISLVEAYNYAYSEVSHQFPNQTPEIFMSSQNKNINLMKYDMTDNPEEIKKIKAPLQFLLQTGIILCNNKWSDKTIKVGVRALNIVLKNSPNNSRAYAVRGSALRVLGKYDLALSDMARIDQKCQIYARLPENGESTIALYKKNDEEVKIEGVEIKENSVLTITQAYGDNYYVTEVDNKRLGDKCGWIKKENIHWKVQLSRDQIIATQNQVARIYNQPAPHYSPNSIHSSPIPPVRFY